MENHCQAADGLIRACEGHRFEDAAVPRGLRGDGSALSFVENALPEVRGHGQAGRARHDQGRAERRDEADPGERGYHNARSFSSPRLIHSLRHESTTSYTVIMELFHSEKHARI